MSRCFGCVQENCTWQTPKCDCQCHNDKSVKNDETVKTAGQLVENNPNFLKSCY